MEENTEIPPDRHLTYDNHDMAVWVGTLGHMAISILCGEAIKF